jgi:hypothetical protein
MTLFSFFKKKAEPENKVTPTDGIKALADGILFEEEGVFLSWGADIEGDKSYARKGYRADRTIYEWGEKVILGGLRLPLKTVCWSHKQHGDIKSFESIEFLLEGNDAEDNFTSIKKHIEPIFGEPKQPEDIRDGDICLEWKIKAVKVSLSLFNKSQPQVHLQIGWWL